MYHSFAWDTRDVPFQIIASILSMAFWNFFVFSHRTALKAGEVGNENDKEVMLFEKRQGNREVSTLLYGANSTAHRGTHFLAD